MKTAIFTGHARASSHSATGQRSKLIQVVLEIDKSSGTIVAADVNVASPVSRQYLVNLMVGRSVMGDLAEISKEIERDYHSPSQKAVLQALHDVSRQYMTHYLKVMSTPFGQLDE